MHMRKNLSLIKMEFDKKFTIRTMIEIEKRIEDVLKEIISKI